MDTKKKKEKKKIIKTKRVWFKKDLIKKKRKDFAPSFLLTESKYILMSKQLMLHKIYPIFPTNVWNLANQVACLTLHLGFSHHALVASVIDITYGYKEDKELCFEVSFKLHFSSDVVLIFFAYIGKTIITVHHLFWGHCLKSSVIDLDLDMFFFRNADGTEL